MHYHINLSRKVAAPEDQRTGWTDEVVLSLNKFEGISYSIITQLCNKANHLTTSQKSQNFTNAY